MVSAAFPPTTSTLAGRFPSIIQTRRGKTIAMEETNKALADLTAAISGISSQIGEIHPIVLELQGWRPAVERSVEDLRSEVGEL